MCPGAVGDPGQSAVCDPDARQPADGAAGQQDQRHPGRQARLRHTHHPGHYADAAGNSNYYMAFSD